MARYFKILGLTAADKTALQQLLSTKTFYPEPTSATPLPAVGDADPVTFDYRQFFRFIGVEDEGGVIVKTRAEYVVGDFDAVMVPTLEWVNRYRLSGHPTITVATYTGYDSNGRKMDTSLDVFKMYNYPPYLNS